MNKENFLKIKSKIFDKIKSKTTKVLVGATIFSSTAGVAQPSFASEKDDNGKNKQEMVDNQKQLFAFETDENAFSQPISFISTQTEVELAKFSNPAMVATGNGYYGQNQLNFANAKRYIAYCLANTSGDVQKSYLKFLSGDNNQELLDAFVKSVDEKSNAGNQEVAYIDINPNYKKLVAKISSQNFGSKWKTIHNEIPDKIGQNLQSDFLYDVYVHIMGVNIKKMQEKHSHIDFDKIHPAVLSAFLAVSVKTGNGTRISQSLAKAKDVKEVNSKEFLKSFCMPENGTKYSKIFRLAKDELGKTPTIEVMKQVSKILKSDKIDNDIKSFEKSKAKKLEPVLWNQVAKNPDVINAISNIKFNTRY